MPPRHAVFAFDEALLEGRTVRLRYALRGGPDPDVAFEERLELPPELPAPDPEDPVVRALLDGMLRVFGVSYYKAAVPGTIHAAPVPEADARFWDWLYGEGLGEFWYRNQLEPSVRFPRGGDLSPVAARPVGDAALVLVGGGKDSLVAREVAREAGVPADALSLGTADWIVRSAARMGLRHLVIRRRIDPRLLELNRAGAWNGHVPISACIAFVSLLVAVAGGYGSVVVANERSADTGNVRWAGLDVNHQWSKSFGFEAAFHAWCERRFQGGPRYFSVLRPLAELSIAEIFARHPAYFDDFTSCNANFRLHPSGPVARWCGRCPKCVFVALLLRPFVADADFLRIFGRDFLGDPENRALLDELAGVRGIKPFECVGTDEETRAALARLRTTGRLPEPLIAWYDAEVAPLVPDPAALWEEARVPRGPHLLPARWEAALKRSMG